MHEKMRICESGPGERALERSAHLGGWMVLGRAAPKVLERSRIVLLRAHALGIHVAQVREGRRLASGGSLRVVVKGLGRIGRQPVLRREPSERRVPVRQLDAAHVLDHGDRRHAHLRMCIFACAYLCM